MESWHPSGSIFDWSLIEMSLRYTKWISEFRTRAMKSIGVGKEEMDSSNLITSSSISCSLMCVLKRERLSAVRLPWVVERMYLGSSPISSATLP